MREETAFYAHKTRFLLGEKHNFAVLKAYVLFELVYTTTQRRKDNCKLSESCPSCRKYNDSISCKKVVISCPGCRKIKNDNIDNKRQLRVQTIMRLI